MGKLSPYPAQRAFMREQERLGTADARHFRGEETSRFCGLKITGDGASGGNLTGV